VSSLGRFITLEGIEGAGKSSLQRALTEALRAGGRTVVCTREPGGTALAEEIRQLALARRADGMPATTELLLMFAARAAHVEQLIRPALERGEWVVCDRFTDASRAYQGGGRGLPMRNIDSLAQIAHPHLQANLTLLLDVTPALGLARARQRNAQGDRFEDEALEFFARVRASYLQLARAEPERIKVLDASQSPEQLLRQALAFAEGL
jgi:dTMP kinase